VTRVLPAVFLLALFLASCADDRNECVRMHAEIQEMIDAKAEEYGFPGLVVGVETPACGRWIGTAGLASRDPETPMRPGHIIPIGSVSKIFVATVVLQLAEENLLDLDGTLSGWHPDFPNADSITIRQLLNHTAGTYNYFPDTANPCYQVYATEPGRTWTPQEVIACASGYPADFAPGQDWNYSNTGYLLLGTIVESVTGNGLYDEMTARLFDPLGMNRTFYKAVPGMPGERARCYFGEEDISEKFNPTFVFGCGGMESNASDLLTLLRAVVTGDLLSESSLSQMLDCVDTHGYPMGDYGFGIACRSHALAGQLYGHAGRGDGMVELFHSADWDTTLVVLVNHRFNTALWSYPTYVWTDHLAPILDRYLGG
jgi:D-alanyl-D-alanine carboxypeptidase